jgi:large subunit ribosomal protein L4
MAQAPVVDMSGNKVREQSLPDEVFGILPNRGVMHQALVRQEANRRQGTHDTQGRSDVSRTSAKWFRQKGTGHARHGAREAALFVGGGVAHGPHPRSYRKAMPRKMRRLALRSALSAKAADSGIVLIERFDIEAPRTRTLRDLVDRACDGASTLVLLADRNDAVERSIRNLADVRYLRAAYLNVRDVLAYERLLMPLDALDAVIAHLSDQVVVEAEASDA